jgi:hypothetical protein
MSLIKWNPNANLLSAQSDWDHFLTEFLEMAGKETAMHGARQLISVKMKMRSQ